MRSSSSVVALLSLTACGSPTFTLADASRSGSDAPVGDASPHAVRDASSDASTDASRDAPLDSPFHDARHAGDAATDVASDGAVQDAKAGQDAGRDTGVDALTCESELSPRDAPCVITEEYGVFVSPSGSNAMGDGTRAAPYLTIGEGILKAAGKRVYVCGGTYLEHLVLTGAATSLGGTAVYGGLSCPSPASPGEAWAYTGALANVSPLSLGYALDIENVSVGAHFEDVGFAAQDADPSVPGAASIAVLVNLSNAVSFTRVTAMAGTASEGMTASTPTTNWCLTANQAAPMVQSGGSCVCTATTDSSSGGAGGDEKQPGMSGTSVPPLVDAPANGGVALSCTNGGVGTNGSPTSAGVAGATGTLTAAGWTAMAAGTGAAGNPGQGGGGGGGSNIANGNGGAAGGCGGNGGSGGGGGGASIAFAVIASPVTFTSITLISASGGAGGTGAGGEPGQAGGAAGGLGVRCMGGAGGAGAGGAGGGGGAGGPSLGIGWSGMFVPTVDGLSVPMAAALPSPSSFAGTAGGPAGSGGTGGAAPVVGASVGTTGTSGSVGPLMAIMSF